MTGPSVTESERAEARLLAILHETCDAVSAALATVEDWGLAGTRSGQHHSDLAADAAALDVLTSAGLGILSEESGLTDPDQPLLAVIDPLDGSSNAWRRIPWYATAVCIVDADGPWLAVVANQATNSRFEAIRGGGATLDGKPIAPSGRTELNESLLALTAWPRAHMGWRQFRALGAAALDMCAVAGGVVDAFVDCTPTGIHGVWDYLAASLVCTEAGAFVGEIGGRDLLVRDPAERRGPAAAATRSLLDQVLAGHARHLGPGQ